jgi:peroxiredoxin
MEHSPQVGDRIPAFEARDQHGRLRIFDSVRGAAGAVIVFIRSADW